MNFHYYPPYDKLKYGPGLLGQAYYFRHELESRGITGKTYMCSETGWHSNNDFPSVPSSPDIQAQYAVKILTWGYAANLETTIWFMLHEPGDPYPFDNGLLDESKNPKPAFYAFKFWIEILHDLSPRRILSSEELGSDELEGYLFSGSVRSVYVLWSDDDETRPVSIPSAQASRFDKFGSRTIISDADDGVIDGHVTVSVGPDPIYIQVIP